MIIPVKCFTCGNMLADKYGVYLKRVRKYKLATAAEAAASSSSLGKDDTTGGAKHDQVLSDKVRYFSKNSSGQKTEEGRVLDELKLNLQCCRRHLLTHVDIE
jgi:DNA-directed RNA polymerase subunit N (RpoN/RPB10)